MTERFTVELRDGVWRLTDTVTGVTREFQDRSEMELHMDWVESQPG